jgi:hypothetical protein
MIKACVICGGPFEARKGALTCSTACSYKRKNRLERELRAGPEGERVRERMRAYQRERRAGPEGERIREQVRERQRERRAGPEGERIRERVRERARLKTLALRALSSVPGFQQYAELFLHPDQQEQEQ